MLLRNIFYKENNNIAFILQHYFVEKREKKKESIVRKSLTLNFSFKKTFFFLSSYYRHTSK